MGRTKDIIVLPNGLNVYPEDIENALRTAGLRDSVVIETKPGRIEAVVLAAGRLDGRGDAARRSARRSRPGSRRPTRRWPSTSGSPGSGSGPRTTCPRTHTLKVKRDVVRRWAAVDEPLPVREGGE